LRSKESNPRGFWESKKLYTLHESLLASVNSSWDDYQRLDQDWMEKQFTYHRKQIKEAIAQEFGEAPVFVLKDPRICRFVPLTLSVLDELNARSIGVLLIRNPLEVASSLRVRDGFPLQKSLLLWLRHVLDAEYYSRSMHRCFLHYDDLMASWRACVQRLADNTGLNLHRSKELEQAIDSFLTPGLRHHFVSLEQLESHDEVGSRIKDAYRIVSRMAEKGENPADLDLLDVIRGTLDEACEVRADEALTIKDRSAGANATVQALSPESKALRARQAHQRKRIAKNPKAESKALAGRKQRLTARSYLNLINPLWAFTAKLPRLGLGFLRRS
jgi:hypothetical protein